MEWDEEYQSRRVDTDAMVGVKVGVFPIVSGKTGGVPNTDHPGFYSFLLWLFVHYHI